MFVFNTTATIEAIDPPKDAPGRNGSKQTRRVLRLRNGENVLHVTFFGKRADGLRWFRQGDRVSVEFELRTKTFPRQDPFTGEQTEHAVTLTFGLDCVMADEDGSRGGGRGRGDARR